MTHRLDQLAGVISFILVATFLVSGFSKARDVMRSDIVAVSLKLPPFFRSRAVPILSAMAVVELSLAVLLVVRATIGALLAIPPLAAYSFYIYWHRPTAGCQCFGGWLEFGGWRGALSRNLVLLSLSVFAASRPKPIAGTRELALALGIAFVGLAADRMLSSPTRAERL